MGLSVYMIPNTANHSSLPRRITSCFRLIFNGSKKCIGNICLLIVCCLSNLQGFAQQMPIEWRVTNYDESKGLSNRKITQLLQDYKGYLWIGTADGLNRFDGYTFKTFRKIPGDSSSIGGNYISSLAEDKDHNIWIAFLTGGICCYNVNSGRFTNYLPSNKPGSLPANEISTIFIDKNNDVWAGVTQKGLYHLDKKTGSFSSYRLSSFDDPFYTAQSRSVYNSVYAIHEDGQGMFWMATHDGLYTFNKKTNIFTPIREKPLKPGMFRNDLFNTIIADTVGGLWMGSWAGGISYYNRRTKQWNNYIYDSVNKEKPTTNIITDLKSRQVDFFWVTTFDRGFGLFNLSTRRFLFFNDKDGFHKNIPSNLCYRVMEDREHNIWISHNGGLTKIEQRKRIFPFKAVGVKRSDNGEFYEVSSVLDDADSTHQYIATSLADGLHVINKQTGDTSVYSVAIKQGEENFQAINDVMQNSRGAIWVLSRDYLYRFDKK